MNKPENAKGGRSRVAWPIVEGIGALAAQIGVSESVIKQVKRNGSRAFLTHNRIDTAILLPEIFSHLSKATQLPDGIATPQDWLATEKAKREAIRRQKDEGETMPTIVAQTQAAEAMSETFAHLERLARELPPALAGLTAVEICKRMTADIETMRKTLKEKFEEVGK